jgi:hypothetical protein
MNAKLKTKESSYEVLMCNYEVFREVDEKHFPATDIRDGTISVVIKSSKVKDVKQKTELWDWMHGKSAMSGSVEFYDDIDPENPMKVLEFTDAHLIKYGEVFDVIGANKAQVMLEKFTISGHIVSVKGTDKKLLKSWK